MDFRSVSKLFGTQLAVPPTHLTPQLEDYDLLHNFRGNELCKSKEDGPFHLVFNLSCVQLEDLALTFPKENVLQVQVVHSRREVSGTLFARDCVYKFDLPNDVSKNPLTALWTQDDYMVVVESSNVIDDTKGKDAGAAMDVEETGGPKLLKPRKVNLFLKPKLNPTVLRHAIEHSELGLSHAKTIVQNCSFVRPNTNNLSNKIEKTDSKEIEVKTKLPTPTEERLEEVMKDSFLHALAVKKVVQPETTNGSGTSVKQIVA